MTTCAAALAGADFIASPSRKEGIAQNLYYRDGPRSPSSAAISIRPEHVMASGSLPPGFPPVEIDVVLARMLFEEAFTQLLDHRLIARGLAHGDDVHACADLAP